MEENPQNREETGRNPDGTFKPGFSGNPGGRPKNSLKLYLQIKLSNMNDEEKEAWLKEHNITGDLQWRMAEGQPHQTSDMTSKGEKIQPIYAGSSVQGHDGNAPSVPNEKKD